MCVEPSPLVDVLSFIQRCVRERKILWTYHANMRLIRRFIPRNTLIVAVETFEIIEEAEPLNIEPPRPLRGRALENLVAFTRLLGYIRYFHPSDEAREADWSEMAMAGVRAVESAENPAQLAGSLNDIFAHIAPTVRVFETDHGQPKQTAVTTPTGHEDLKLMVWRHHGLGSQGNTSTPYTSEVFSRRVRGGKIPRGIPNPEKPFAAELGGGVSCQVPLAVYADENGTIPKTGESESSADPESRRPYTGGDRTTRLADVALCWNVMQHFYPYFDVVDTDWSRALTTALSAAATDADGRCDSTAAVIVC